MPIQIGLAAGQLLSVESQMTSNRFLEAIKRLLAAEKYFRSREKAEEREPERPAPERDK